MAAETHTDRDAARERLLKRVRKRGQLSRKRRRQLGRAWVKLYDGDDLVGDYARLFGVDPRCVLRDLARYRLPLPPDVHAQVEAGRRRRWKRRQPEPLTLAEIGVELEIQRFVLGAEEEPSWFSGEDISCARYEGPCESGLQIDAVDIPF